MEGHFRLCVLVRKSCATCVEEAVQAVLSSNSCGSSVEQGGTEEKKEQVK